MRSSIPIRSFPIYESVIRFLGAKPVPVPSWRAEGFRSISRFCGIDCPTRPSSVILNSPANPTGE